MRHARANRVSCDAGATRCCARMRDQRERIAMAVARAPSSGVIVRRRRPLVPADRDVKPANVPRKRNVVRLKVIGGTVELDDFVPATIADCPPPHLVCGHLRCKWNLLRVDGPDQPGRPRSSTSTRYGSNARPTEIVPFWYEWPVRPSCFLRAIETAAREEWNLEQMSRTFGVTRRGMKYLLSKSLAKVKRAGGESREMLLELIAPEPARNSSTRRSPVYYGLGTPGTP